MSIYWLSAPTPLLKYNSEPLNICLNICFIISVITLIFGLISSNMPFITVGMMSILLNILLYLFISGVLNNTIENFNPSEKIISKYEYDRDNKKTPKNIYEIPGYKKIIPTSLNSQNDDNGAIVKSMRNDLTRNPRKYNAATHHYYNQREKLNGAF